MLSVRALTLALIAAACFLILCAAEQGQIRDSPAVNRLVNRVAHDFPLPKARSAYNDLSSRQSERGDELASDGLEAEPKAFPLMHLDLGKRQNGSSKPTSPSTQPTETSAQSRQRTADAPTSDSAVSESTSISPSNEPTSNSRKIVITTGTVTTVTDVTTTKIIRTSTDSTTPRTTASAQTTNSKTTTYKATTTTRYGPTSTSTSYYTTTARERPSRSYSNPLITDTASSTFTTSTRTPRATTSSTPKSKPKTTDKSVPVATVVRTSTSTAEDGKQTVITMTRTREGNGKDPANTTPQAQLQTGNSAVDSQQRVAKWAVGAGAVAAGLAGFV